VTAELGWRFTDTIKFQFRKHFSADVRALKAGEGFTRQREGCLRCTATGFLLNIGLALVVAREVPLTASSPRAIKLAERWRIAT
jgi:hypothetical protein